MTEGEIFIKKVFFFFSLFLIAVLVTGCLPKFSAPQNLNQTLINQPPANQNQGPLSNVPIEQLPPEEVYPEMPVPEEKPSAQLPLCQNFCGDGVCQQVVCLGSGCPCAENAAKCPKDCQSGRKN